ncbi:MAG: Cob(I)alamin adenosyltransferase @ Cob(I)alamin adenosyltransferase, clustered with cobalamin synthesis, partial [uncultured Rubrobacteraceae bacterium]
ERGWRSRGPGAAGAEAQAQVEQGEAAPGRKHRAREGQEHGVVWDHAQGMGPRLPRRRLPVRQERQVERRRAAGRRGLGQHRLVQAGRRLDLDRKRPGALRRPGPRGLGGGQAPPRRRDLRHAPPRRVHLPDEVRLGRHQRGRRGPEEPPGLPARDRHRPRRAAGARRGGGPRERGKEGQAPHGRGLPRPEGHRVV